MVTSPKGPGPKKDYAGECQQHIQTTDPFSRQRGHPQKQGRNCQRLIDIWSKAPDGCFILRQTGRLTVGRNIRLRLNLVSLNKAGLEWTLILTYHRSWRLMNITQRTHLSPINHFPELDIIKPTFLFQKCLYSELVLLNVMCKFII
jgi:hypothetical protein